MKDINRQNLYYLAKHIFEKERIISVSYTHLIVQAYHSHGFDKDCGAAGGLVVDHTGHLAAVFRFYRKAVTAVPHGDHCVLQISAHGTIYHGIQLGVDPVVGELDTPADLAERTAGLIADLFLGQDAPADFRRNRGERNETIKIVVQ